MPRNPAQNQRIKDERREAIMVAAARVFARRGLASTKISDIAHAAGLSHGLVYHYFESKETLYVDVIRELLRDSRALLDECAAKEASPLDRLGQYVGGVIERIEESPEGVLLVLQVMVNEECCREARDFFDNHAKHTFSTVRALIIEARAAGQIGADGDPNAIATALFALMHGLALGILIGVPVPRRTPGVDLVLRLLSPTDPGVARQPNHSPARPRRSKPAPRRRPRTETA